MRFSSSRSFLASALARLASFSMATASRSSAAFCALVILRGAGTGDGDASALINAGAPAGASPHLQIVLGQLGGLLLQLVSHHVLSARAPPMALHDLGSPPETSADTYLEPTDPAVRTSRSSPS